MLTKYRKNPKKGVGRKSKSDPVMVRLISEENGHFDIQFQKLGFKERSKFLKALIFEREAKVVKLDKVAMDYYIRLTNFYHQSQAIGNNYNWTVRAVKANFGDKQAFAFASKLGKESFIGAFNEWYERNKEVVNERVHDKRIKKKTPPYMRPRLRSAYLSIRWNLPLLWTFYDYPSIGLPNTNNGLEVIFSDIKTKLRVHSGLTRKHIITVR